MGRNPLSIFTYGLLFYALVTLGFNLDVPHLFHALAVALLFGIAYLVMRFAMKTRIDWRNFMISGIIMFLLIEPEIGALEYTFLTLAVFLVVIAKSIRYKGQPIVNPVVFGISISYLILLLSGQFLFVTWWGAAYRNWLSLLFLAPVAIYGAYSFRKLWLAAFYVLTYGLLGTFLLGLNPFYLFGTGTLYFAGAIMLLEPKTSPILKKEQIIFGVVAGILTFIFSRIPQTLPFVMGIAVTNLLWTGKKALR